MRFRAYFNRHREAPQVCSVDEGTQESEINVKGFVVHSGCRVWSEYNGAKANDVSPSFWVWIEADSYRVLDGFAHFRTMRHRCVIESPDPPYSRDCSG